MLIQYKHVYIPNHKHERKYLLFIFLSLVYLTLHDGLQFPPFFYKYHYFVLLYGNPYFITLLSPLLSPPLNIITPGSKISVHASLGEQPPLECSLPLNHGRCVGPGPKCSMVVQFVAHVVGAMSGRRYACEGVPWESRPWPQWVV